VASTGHEPLLNLSTNIAINGATEAIAGDHQRINVQGGRAMEYLLSAAAFAGLIAAQFLAVVFVTNQHSKIRSSEDSASSKGELHNRKMRLPSILDHRNSVDKEIWQ
jgi:hypothetical protein